MNAFKISQELYPDHGAPVDKTSGLRRIALQAASTAAASTTADESKLPLRQVSVLLELVLLFQTGESSDGGDVGARRAHYASGMERHGLGC